MTFTRNAAAALSLSRSGFFSRKALARNHA